MTSGEYATKVVKVISGNETAWMEIEFDNEIFEPNDMVLTPVSAKTKPDRNISYHGIIKAKTSPNTFIIESLNGETPFAKAIPGDWFLVIVRGKIIRRE